MKKQLIALATAGMLMTSTQNGTAYGLNNVAKDAALFAGYLVCCAQIGSCLSGCCKNKLHSQKHTCSWLKWTLGTATTGGILLLAIAKHLQP